MDSYKKRFLCKVPFCIGITNDTYVNSYIGILPLDTCQLFERSTVSLIIVALLFFFFLKNSLRSSDFCINEKENAVR